VRGIFFELESGISNISFRQLAAVLVLSFMVKLNKPYQIIVFVERIQPALTEVLWKKSG